MERLATSSNAGTNYERTPAANEEDSSLPAPSTWHGPQTSIEGFPESFPEGGFLQSRSASSPNVLAGESPASAMCNAAIQRALSSGSVSGKLDLSNRRNRRAMRKRRNTDLLGTALGLGPVPRATATRRGAQTPQTQAPESAGAGFSVPSPTFTRINSTTAFGAPADISMGWDGTFWAIDASGAPNLYDPSQNQWSPHGDGVDAVAAVGNTLYLFKNGESLTDLSSCGQVIQVDLASNQAGEPAAIGSVWKELPDSFKIGITGAANLAGTLYLFKGGWYLPVSAPAQRALLTTLEGWPTTSNWVDGVIDAVVSNGSASAWTAPLYQRSSRAVRNSSSSTSETAKSFLGLRLSIKGLAGRRPYLPVGLRGGGTAQCILSRMARPSSTSIAAPKSPASRHLPQP